MEQSFSLEEEKVYKKCALPVERLKEECSSNLVLKNSLEEVFEACRVYAEKLYEIFKTESLETIETADIFEKEVHKLYEYNPELENTIAESIPKLLRLLNMKNIDEVGILRSIKTPLDYARCALETTQKLQQRNTANTRRAA